MAATEKIYFRPARKIGGFTADVTLEEQHNDSSTITDHPVERGSAISDHVYRNPNQLTVVVGWSNSSLKAAGDAGYVQRIYQQILALQATGNPFDVVTGKRRYRNMLIQAIATTTDPKTENALILTISMRTVIIVETKSTKVPPSTVHAAPQKTQEVAQTGTKQAQPAPKVNESALSKLFGG